MHQDLSTLPGRGSLVVTCAECPNQFRIFPSFLTYRPNPTCSRACKVARQERIAREKNSRPCVVCGVLFYRAPSSFEKKGRKCCSLACRAIWQTGRKIPWGDPVKSFHRMRVVQDGCYGWTGATNMGYGVLSDGKRTVGAHRFAWQLATGETLTEQDTIAHICDNPPCTNTEEEGTYEAGGITWPRRGHLFKTTDYGNTHDRMQKGRSNHHGATGEQNSHARLTADLIRYVRASDQPSKILADELNVTTVTINMIRRRQTWKHID